MGVAVGDYDNDGRPDIYVSNYGVSRLYHNNGDGTFTDVAEKLGCARKGWSTGPSFGDYDRDVDWTFLFPAILSLILTTSLSIPRTSASPVSRKTFASFAA